MVKVKDSLTQPSSASAKFSIEVLMEEKKPALTEKLEFEDWIKFLVFVLFETLDYQDSDAKTKIRNSSIKCSFTNLKFCLENLTDEIGTANT